MQVEVPAELKSSVPHTMFGKLLAATPVVMAVIATMLAGLSSSEMTAAQYARSLAAQQQSKAGDQWSFFQAKRQRGEYQSNTAQLLQSLTPVHPLNPDALQSLPGTTKQFSDVLNSSPGKQAMRYLQHGTLPDVPPAPPQSAQLKAALAGLDNLDTDSQMESLLAPVTDQDLESALRSAQDRAQAFDTATAPINDAIDKLQAQLSLSPIAAATSDSAAAQTASTIRDFTVASQLYTAARYLTEAHLNQSIANLYELQVRKSNFAAQRHYTRSQRFFYGMLAAQLGVIISTFAMAARQRNLLWSLATAAGLLALSFAAWVYLYT